MTLANEVARAVLSFCAAGAAVSVGLAQPGGAAAPSLAPGPPPAAEVPRREIAGHIVPSVVLVTASGEGETTQGSGFVVDAGGVVVTALHVVDGARKVTVTLLDGRRTENVSVRAFDAERDLAVILVRLPSGGKEIAAVTLGKPATVEPGDPVLVVSNPYGFKHSVTEGIVSAWRTPEDEAVGDSTPDTHLLLPSCRLLQISAAISPGSSGGPVVDQRGEVIGVATAGVLYGLADLNFAVPITELPSLLEAHGEMDLGTFQTRLRDARFSLAHPHFESAQIALDQGRREEAQRHLGRAILLFPGYEEALLLSARLLREDGHPDQAMARVTEAVRSNEDSAEAWYQLGRMHEWMSRIHSDTTQLTKARADYEKTLALDPRHASAALALAVLQVRQGSLAQAEALLLQAISLSPDLADAHYVLGEIYVRKMRLGDAEEAFKKALGADRDHVLSHFALARLYTGWNSTSADLAQDHWRAFLRLAKDDPAYAEELEVAHRLIEQHFPSLVDW
jgi:tetratricopeptide (TPR) repeat protein